MGDGAGSRGRERISLYVAGRAESLPGVEPYGLLRKDNSLRPAFYTYRALVTYLGDYTNARLTRQGNLRRVVVNRGGRGTTTVVWNLGLSAETMSVPGSAPTALLVDPLGPCRNNNGSERSIFNYASGKPGWGHRGQTVYDCGRGRGAIATLPRWCPCFTTGVRNDLSVNACFGRTRHGGAGNPGSCTL